MLLNLLNTLQRAAPAINNYPVHDVDGAKIKETLLLSLGKAGLALGNQQRRGRKIPEVQVEARIQHRVAPGQGATKGVAQWPRAAG